MTAVADTILRELRAIQEYMDAIQDVLKSGRMPEMIGFEKRVSDLCLMIQQADPEAQQPCVSELKKLLVNIDACEEDLRAFNARFLGGTDTHD